MKKIYIVFLLMTGICFSQSGDLGSFKLGQTTIKEVKMKVYDKDSTAVAVVLLEKGNTYHDESGRNLNLITDYYVRIKILKKEGFAKATVTVPWYKKEKIKDLRGVTYSLSETGAMIANKMQEASVFRKKINKNFSEVRFTLPNIKVGSVIEYRYSLHSEYYENLNDWVFQSDIPKVESRYDSSILANWKYNIRLNGYLKLDIDNPSVKKLCVSIPGLGGGQCIKLSYAMFNVPAFKKEKHLSSRKNYTARLIFDLISFTGQEYKESANSYSQSTTKEVVKKYTNTWKDVDGFFKKDVFKSQLSKSKFLKKELPSKIINETNKYQQANLTFNFIQKHFNWNNYYWPKDKLNVKESYQEKTGSIVAINISLYNALQALDIESYVTILSTRGNGFVTELFPVINDFNYVIVKVIINGKRYFLDATDKYLGFGQVRFDCINGKVRVLDFKNGSYWDVIKLKEQSSVNTRLKLTLNDQGVFKGVMTTMSKGYSASDKRERLDTRTNEQYLEEIETVNPYLEINEYKVIDQGVLEKPLKESFDIEMFDDSNSNENLRIFPFFDERIKENPFKLKERKYPVDFGKIIKYSYSLNLKIPEKYTIKNVPKNTSFSLPGKAGLFMLKVQQKENEINIFMRYSINKKIFHAAEYQKLKEFFNQIITAQNSFIEISTN
ncbi:MAG: DUF3857 domain-containing protein [Flavobacteriaceae bacterium]|nr:DUF3857 domain-containing protein [Flavobacteriaceae bacterium]